MNSINFKQASELLNLKESRIRYLVFKRKIPFIKIGSTIRFDKNDLEKWLNQQKVEVVCE